jgi:hypothetical protein
LILPAAVPTTWLAFGVAPVMASSPSPVYDSLPPSGTGDGSVVRRGGAAVQPVRKRGHPDQVREDRESVRDTGLVRLPDRHRHHRLHHDRGRAVPDPHRAGAVQAQHHQPNHGRSDPDLHKERQHRVRPSADPTCANPTQYRGSDGVCHNGIRQNIVFNFPDTKLPATVVWGVTYNTDHQGPNPIGGSGAPTDSLNVGVTTAVKTGLNRTDDSIFWDTSTLANTCADPTNGNSGPFVTGEFNRDGPCDGTTNSWAGLIPAAKFTPVG